MVKRLAAIATEVARAQRRVVMGKHDYGVAYQQHIAYII